MASIADRSLSDDALLIMIIYKSARWILTKRMEYNFKTCSEAWKDISLLLREEKINTNKRTIRGEGHNEN